MSGIKNFAYKISLMGGIGFFLLAISFILSQGGATALADGYMPEVDLWPIFFYDRDEDTDDKQVEVLWPFFRWERDDEQSSLFFRPFWNRRIEHETGEYRSQFIYPFGATVKRQQELDSRFFYIYRRTRKLLPDGTDRREFNLLPFIMTRTDDGELENFAFFPLYGDMKDWFGRDRAVIVLWPLFTYQRTGENRKYNVLFPIISWKTGEPESGFKVWPFYGRREGTRGEKTFVMWPLYDHERFVLRKGVERETYLSWPFWYQEDSPGGYQRSVLWPFFTRRYEVAGDVSRWEVPWPFITWETSDEGDALGLWPLYARRRSQMEKSNYALWPFIWWSEEDRGVYGRESFRVLPFYRKSREWRREEERSIFQLWPLYQHRRETDGSIRAELPALWLWWDSEGYDRNYAPFLRLLEYRSRPDYGRSVRLLWRLARWETTPDSWFAEVTPLVAAHRRKPAEDDAWNTEERSRFTLLKGLVDYRRKGDERRLKLLYFIPAWPFFGLGD